MANLSVTASGIVLGPDVAGLVIEAWDAGGVWPDLIDCAVTDAGGRFTMHLDYQAYLGPIFAGRTAVLSFRACRGDEVLADTRGRVVWSARQAATPIHITLDGPAPPGNQRPAPFVVRGRAFDAARNPLRGGSVQVFRRSLTAAGLHDEMLGRAPVGADGTFRVEYWRPDHRRTDLIVQATDGHGRVLVKLLHGQAPTSLVVDLMPPAARELPDRADVSRFERHLDLIRPVLAGRGPAELDAREARFVAGATGIDRTELDQLRDVTRLARDTGVAPPVLAALAHGGLPVDLGGLARHGRASMIAAVDRAVANNAAPASVHDGLDGQLAMLQDRIVDHVLRPAPAGSGSSLGDLLRSSALPRRLHAPLVRRYLDRTGSSGQLWADLARDREFGPDAVAQAQLALELAVLTDGDAQLVARLSQRRGPEAITAAADLAWIDLPGWQRLVREAGTVANDQVARRAAQILASVDLAHPDRALHRRLAQAPQPDLGLVRALHEANPALDLRQRLPEQVDRGRIRSGDLAAARAAWNAAAAEARAYPAFDYRALLASRAGDLHNPIRAGAARLLANLGHPDLRTAKLRTLVAERGAAAFAGMDPAVREQAVDQVQATQRVFRVAAPDQVEPLLAAGHRTVRSIATTPAAFFVPAMADQLGGVAAATAVHERAVVYASAVAAVYRAFAEAHQPTLPYAIGGTGPTYDAAPAWLEKQFPGEATDGVANWRTLFGTLALCECEHCESVYSPAAYLVDLLHFLDRAPAGPAGSPLAVLRRRRPDLARTRLTCENTNTPMPHVDLVNEALESYLKIRYVDHGDPSEDLAAYDTNGASAAELRAVPQNVLDDAYAHLSSAVYPTSLPFHRPLAVTRAYLNHLGVSRRELMAAYRTPTGPTATAVVAESLGLSGKEFGIIAGLDPAGTQEFYGYPPTQNAPGWWVDLTNVEKMLTRTGLELVDLVEILRTWYVNRNQSVGIVTATLDCDVSQLTLTGLEASAPDAAGFVDRLHRFVRLWRALNRAQPGQPAPGWSMSDLDRALYALGASTVDSAALRRVDDACRAVAAVRVPLVQALCLWADLDVWGEDALYLRLFRNRAVLQLDPTAKLHLHYRPGAGPDVRDPQKMPYLDSTNKLGDDIPALLAGVRLTEPDLRLVMQREGLTDATPLSISVVSRILRYAVLARATKLRVRDLLVLLRLTGVNPFAPTDPAGLLDFLTHLRRVRDCRMTVAALDYICGGVADPLAGVAPTPNETDNALKALRVGLLAVAADAAMPEDPDGEQLSAWLASWVAPDAVEPLQAMLLGDASAYPTNVSDFLTRNLGWLISPADAAAVLTVPAQPLTPQQQHQRVAWLVRLVRAHRARDVVVTTLASALRVEPPVVTLLLDTQLTGRVVPGESAMADYLALMDADATPNHAIAYELAHKAALLIRGLRLTARELAHLKAHSTSWANVNLDAMPLQPVDDASAAAQFGRWSRAADLAALRDRLPHGERTLIDVFEHDVSTEPNPMQALSADLAMVAGWPEKLLEQLVDPAGLALHPDDLRTEQRLLDLERCLDVQRRLGVDPLVLFGWAAAEPTPDRAREAVRAVKARYDDAGWLEVAQTLNDDLRERQRDALVSFLGPRLAGEPVPIKEEVRSAGDLFGYFLIDTQMSACMLTSRIKQAISSTQLFVQRCLLGLENDVRPNQIDIQQWKWRKNYRVWEANRKVFLYPENWIRPELDRDRTPFFRELETALLQSDLTDEHVESVYLRYLEQLDDVSRLTVVGLYHQVEPAAGPTDKAIDVFHVIAATVEGQPRNYYYRRFVNRREWLPWEAIDLDISSDHVAPIVVNRRLYLFWFILTPTTVQDLIYPDGYEGPPQQTYDVALAWSEYRRGRWTPRRVARRTVRYYQAFFDAAVETGYVGTPFPVPPTDAFSILVTEEDEKLVIQLVERGTNAPGAKDDEFTETVTTVVRFTVTSYRGEVTAESLLDLEAGTLYEIDVAVPSYVTMRDSVLTRKQSGGLAISGLYDWPILGKTGGYRMVRQATTGLAAVPAKLYPFSLNDSRRYYFAFPPPGKDQIYVSPAFADLLNVVLHSAALSSGHTKTGPTYRLTGPIVPSSTEPAYRAGAPTVPSADPSPATSSSTGSKKAAVSDSWVQRLLAISGRIRFVTAQHPYTGEFIKALNRHGIGGLLALPIQGLTKDDPAAHGFDFGQTYAPDVTVASPMPTYRVDFDPEGSYARYNWELFFHAPMLIADLLTRDGRFDEARRWMHHILDPTTDDPAPAPIRFWRLLPFRANTAPERAQDLMVLLAYPGSDPTIVARKEAVVAQVAEWTARPFEPHRIARLRLVAYQKYVFMAYLDCLLAQADALFRWNTIESINEAAQLYVLALVMLGHRAPRVPPPGTVGAKTYEELAKLGLDEFSSAAVLENLVPPFSLGSSSSDGAAVAILPISEALYFCTPDNEKLLGYWDQVEDRLFKLRHCLTIEGEFRRLPLFEPPIDPAALVRAVAAGLDLGSAAAEVFAPLPRFRFSYLLAKTLELAGELRSLASLLLSVLEKGDAEALSELRVGHEVALLKAVRAVKEEQVKEAQHTLDSLLKTEEVTTRRRDFYANFRPRNEHELDQLDRMMDADQWQEKANLTEIAVAAAAQIPNVTVGTSGSPSGPVLTTTFGGSNVVAGLESTSRFFTWLAGQQTYKASLAALEAGWARRADDVKLQEDLANRELARIAKQLDAARSRITIAETELANHERQIDQATEIADFLHDRFTNVELYQWMAAQVSSVYHQAYKVAFDLAKRAERAYRFEHGLTASSIVSYGWEGSRKGLLAAERLILDLKRLDTAWLEATPPPYEITKHVSLVLHDPKALMDLKLNGSCEVELPETLFDTDFPGHFMRRIRSLRITIPCVTGPYTSINCTVTLVNSRERISVADPTSYPEAPAGEDPRFRYDFAARQSIVTSHGRSDSGRFALGSDPSTYLPFEGAGAICRLHLDLPRESNGFDFDTISDVVLTIEYTAREGGDLLRTYAKQSLADLSSVYSATDGLNPPLQRLFSARHEFGQDWHAFLRPTPGADQVLKLLIQAEHFPYPLRHAGLTVHRVDLYLYPKEGQSFAPPGLTVALDLPQPVTLSVDLVAPTQSDLPAVGMVTKVDQTTALESTPAVGEWTVTVPGAATPTLTPSKVEDLVILVTYTAA